MMFDRKTGWLNGQATVVAEMPGRGQMGDTKHGRYYWQKDELQLRVQPDGGLPHEVRWKGYVPRQIVGSLQGAALPIKVHPRNPEKLDFDWDGIVANGLALSAPTGAHTSLRLGGARLVFQSDPSSASDVADEIAKLAKLHEQGTLTDDEFAEAKRKLLADR